ncbi:MAG: hypothetical protein HFI37_02295 [Lachnospiraceae bacterium]|jgi:hypothetical protein|nr:hypothetical protein [Lachnospiraceae bacterium]
MQVQLGSFFCWRMKKLAVFALCMGCGVAGMLFADRDTLSGACLIWGLAAYEIIVSLPCVKNTCCGAYVWENGDEIHIRYEPKGIWQRLFFARKKEYVISRKKIREVLLKEIRYGGKWLDVIGYRLTVKESRTYAFDSVLLTDEGIAEKSGWEKFRDFVIIQGSPGRIESLPGEML